MVLGGSGSEDIAWPPSPLLQTLLLAPSSSHPPHHPSTSIHLHPTRSTPPSSTTPPPNPLNPFHLHPTQSTPPSSNPIHIPVSITCMISIGQPNLFNFYSTPTHPLSKPGFSSNNVLTKPTLLIPSTNTAVVLFALPAFPFNLSTRPRNH